MKEIGIKEILRKHYKKYPQMTAQDAVKLLYQREFGGGHLITDEDLSLKGIQEECGALVRGGEISQEVIAEEIGQGLYRLSLHVLSRGLSPATLNRMFFETGKTVQGSNEHFEETLAELADWAKEEISPEEFENLRIYLEAYRVQGYPLVSHSPAYRDNYHPAYRIVAARFISCLDMCCEIDLLLDRRRISHDESPILVAIDGCSASGKTTAAKTLAELYDCHVFHMDHFFLRPEQRTRERFLEPGGNVDYERFYDTVLRPVLQGREFAYQVFDCRRQEFTDTVRITPKRLNLVEGAYSRHPYFGCIYDLGYWLFISFEEQRRRILNRDGAELLERFLHEWIPLEEAYFLSQGVRRAEGNSEPYIKDKHNSGLMMNSRKASTLRS